MTVHANRGRFFEQYLEHLHARYRVQGRARIDFIPTPTRPRNDRDQVTWVPVRKGSSTSWECYEVGALWPSTPRARATPAPGG